MNRAELLSLLADELRLLKEEGVAGIPVSEDSLHSLRTLPRALGSATPPEASRRSSSPPIPPPSPENGDSGQESLPPAPPPFQLPDGSAAEKIDALRKIVTADKVCLANLNPGKKVVLGVGNPEADLFFCGEAPGAEEETQGEPFVGPAGQLLTKMIEAMGLAREDVYIGNIMNWRPQTGRSFGNRPPTAAEMAYCLPYLRAQVGIVRPRVIVALGGTAAGGLLGIDTKGRMGRLRGSWHELDGIPVVVTFHPSFLLHQGSVARKREVWEDLLAVMEKLGLPISEKQRRYFLAAKG